MWQFGNAMRRHTAGGGGRGVAAARGSWCWLLALPADSADGRDDVAAAAAAVAAARKML